MIIEPIATPLPEDERSELSAAVARYGERAVARALGETRHAVLAGAAGAPLRRDVRARLIAALAKSRPATDAVIK